MLGRPRRAAFAPLLLAAVLASGLVAGCETEVTFLFWEQQTRQMITSRAHFTAVVLDDGRILIAGGTVDGQTPLASTEILEPTTGIYTIGIDMISARWGHETTVLPDGRVFVSGGKGASGELDSAEIFDPGTGVWTTADRMFARRMRHSVTPVDTSDGPRLLITGGFADDTPIDTVDLYDPAFNTWTFKEPMFTPRAWHGAIQLSSGRVLVAAGEDGMGALATAELYDLDANIWEWTAPMVGARTDGFGLFRRPDGFIMLYGGRSAKEGAFQTQCDLYDPLTGIWLSGPSMLVGRHGHTPIELADGDLLVVGGYNGLYLRHVERYDVAQAVWEFHPQMLSARAWHGSLSLADGSILALGGFEAEAQTTRWSEVLIRE